MGREIAKEYRVATRNSPLAVVAVLKGAFMFAADLLRAISLPCTIDFISASSYGSEKTSSGKLTLRHTLSLADRHVLLVEDIIDTGLTMQVLTREVMEMKPASLKICTLLDKPHARKHPVEIAYTGFMVPDTFIVGYGTDYNERYRELPAIGVLRS